MKRPLWVQSRVKMELGPALNIPFEIWDGLIILYVTLSVTKHGVLLCYDMPCVTSR